MRNLIFGSHTIETGGIDMAVRRAVGAGLNAVQIFTAIPRFYGDRSSIREERVERFRAALAETGMPASNVLVHAAYVLNLATADDEKWRRARDGLTKEMERSTALGVGAVCFHPGSATGTDLQNATRRIADAMNHALETVDSDVRLFVENTAGAGRTVGRTPEEVGMILDGVDAAHRERVGYGLDTCHLYASGYDIAESRERLVEVLDQFEERTGRAPGFFHLNDSEGELGSNRDRHRLLGEGHIGTEPFGWLLADARAEGIPLMLETPQERTDIDADDAAPDPYDLRMRTLLESLV